MPRKTTHASAGRPKLNINPDDVRKYALLGLKTTEIAGILGCDETVIRKRYKASVLAGKAARVARIRKAQWDSMERLDVAMLIWLGKNELEQTDKNRIEHTGKNGGPIKTENKQAFDWETYRLARQQQEQAGRISATENSN